MQETVSPLRASHQLEMARRDQRQRAEKIRLLKEQLEATVAGHRKKMTEVRTQNMNRLNIIRRFIDEASTQTHESGKRKSEPVSPSSSEGAKNQDSVESAVSSYQPGTLRRDTIVCFEGNMQNDPLSQKYSKGKKKSEAIAPQLIINQHVMNHSPTKASVNVHLTRKAGNLAISVLKHFYSANGCCPSEELPRIREVQSRLEVATKAKKKAETLVASLQEQIEDLNIELKGLSNELKDSSRRYEERLGSYEKKYKARVKAVKKQIENGTFHRSMETWRSITPFSERSEDQENLETAGAKVVNKRSDKKVSTQFDHVIPSVFLMDNSNAEPTEEQEGEQEQEVESKMVRLNDRIQELENEVEELKAQYTKEKSQRLHVMWCLEAKSRQVQNLLSVQEEHSQLLIQHSQLIEENNMLRDRLDNSTENPKEFSDLKNNSHKLESKYALLQTAEIKRLRRALQRATELHPDLVLSNSSSPGGSSIPRKLLSPYESPSMWASSPSPTQKEHSRAKTITVNLQKLVERSTSIQTVRTESTDDTSPIAKTCELVVPSPFQLQQSRQDGNLDDFSSHQSGNLDDSSSPQDETLDDFSNPSYKRTRVGIKPYFVYTLQGSPTGEEGPITFEEQQELAREASAGKWSNSPKESSDFHPAR